MIRSTLAAAIALACLSSCGSSDDGGKESPLPESKPTELVITPAPGMAGGENRTDYALGELGDLGDFTAEVLKFQKNVEPRTSNEPGMRMDAALVKMCNSSVLPDDFPEEVFSALSWQLHDGDDGTYDSSNVRYRQSPKPEFPFEKRLAIGKCVRGWVVFDIPTEVSATKIALVRDAADEATWATK